MWWHYNVRSPLSMMVASTTHGSIHLGVSGVGSYQLYATIIQSWQDVNGPKNNWLYLSHLWICSFVVWIHKSGAMKVNRSLKSISHLFVHQSRLRNDPDRAPPVGLRRFTRVVSVYFSLTPCKHSHLIQGPALSACRNCQLHYRQIVWTGKCQLERQNENSQVWVSVFQSLEAAASLHPSTKYWTPFHIRDNRGRLVDTRGIVSSPW